MRSSGFLLLAALAAAALLAAGCGRSGDLYLPEPQQSEPQQ